MTWEKVERTVNHEGTTITYRFGKTGVYVQSRKRHIPHANGIGTWDHTSYFVLVNGLEVANKMTLAAAKAHAEGLIEGKRGG